jgi:thiamine kinase-like enzyme
VRLVDWEMAGTGPGPLDLAALVAGWPEPGRGAIVAAYVDEAPARLATELDEILDACRLHLAMQWLGWSPTWVPPLDNAHDWVGEAIDAAERLGL